MKRSVIAGLSAIALGLAIASAPTQAEARRNIIGGMSAAEVVGAPYYGYGYYPGDPALYPTPAAFGPPPGCVIRNQKVWIGYRWTWRKLRICH
jgi:hypothetical protein